MPPTQTKIGNVSELTKELYGELYLASLRNGDTRKMHFKLAEARSGPTAVSPSPPSIQEVKTDFTGWFAGATSIVQALDPGVAVPTLEEMLPWITQQKYENVKTAIAA